MTKKYGVFSAASVFTIAVSTFATSLTAGELNILTWEGYADQSVIEPFEAATGCKVSATYVGSNDDFAPKLAAGGGVFDIVTPSIDTTYSLIDAGFVQPIDISRIPAWGDLYEQFTSAPGIQKDGQFYGVPYAGAQFHLCIVKISLTTRPRQLQHFGIPL